jgi:hypothetical protein
MNAIAAYTSAVYSPVDPIQPTIRRQGSEGEKDGGSGRFKATEGHSHAELSSTCPTCGHRLNLSV